VLPMADEPVRTRVTARGRTLPFQQFMIAEGAEGPIEGVLLEGVDRARPTPEVLHAIADADAIVIGPSNPVVSIGPILALPGMAQAISEARAPVVAVSPFVGGRVLKGPTAIFCEHAGIRLGAAGMLDAYPGVLDGVVADEPLPGLPGLQVETSMDSLDRQARLATDTLDFAASLAGAEPPSA